MSLSFCRFPYLSQLIFAYYARRFHSCCHFHSSSRVISRVRVPYLDWLLAPPTNSQNHAPFWHSLKRTPEGTNQMFVRTYTSCKQFFPIRFEWGFQHFSGSVLKFSSSLTFHHAQFHAIISCIFQTMKLNFFTPLWKYSDKLYRFTDSYLFL